MKTFELVTLQHNDVEVQHCIGEVQGKQVRSGHVYRVRHGDTSSLIQFQLGPVKEYGVNGLTNESLLAVLIHRMGILNTESPCVENVQVIGNLISALEQLERRTKDRIERGVEGENKE